MACPLLPLAKLQNNGPKAPPEIPMTNSAEPTLVNLPIPESANGKIAGQTMALASPKKAIKIKVSGY